ncbi:hypothetical protein JCM8202_003432 [Rhodotorula sphaerocarpa]
MRRSHARQYDTSSSSDTSDTDDSDTSSPSEGSGGAATRRPSANVRLLPFLFLLAIIAALGLAWYTFSDGYNPLTSTRPSSLPSLVAVTVTATNSLASHEAPTLDGTSSLTAPSSAAGSSSVSPTLTAGGSTQNATGPGLIGFSDPTCGSSGAVTESSNSAGPNGSEDWLNCGLSKDKPDSPWTPPKIALSQIKTVSLETALGKKNSVYAACKPFVSLFEKYAAAIQVPPIMLAAFAMQESSCDPKTMGDAGGAYGLMQITEDKCGGAPGGNCRDPDFNIKTGAEYFAKVLKEHEGSLLLAMGTYNGWCAGLTYAKATAARHTSCCECQNNLDYHHAMLNGWLQGLDGSQMGTIKNIQCS